MVRLGCRLNVRIASKYIAKVGGRIFSPSSFPHSMQTCDPSPVNTYNKNAQLRCITNILTFNHVHFHFCTFPLLTSVISQSLSTCTFAISDCGQLWSSAPQYIITNLLLKWHICDVIFTYITFLETYILFKHRLSLNTYNKYIICQVENKSSVVWRKIYVKTGKHKFSKHLAASSKFQVTER